MALVSLWKHKDGEKYKRGHIYTLSKKKDEMVARLHLGALGAKLTTLSAE